jgi:uncharacterized membrane protein
MVLLIAGLLLFFVPHSVSIVAPQWRDRMALHLGVGKWKAISGLLSAVGFVLLVVGFAQARRAPILLYVPPAWLHHVTFLLMLPVFPLLFAAYLPGRIQRAAKHPMLAAVKLWATAHLLSNGTLADLLLFGSFLVWAVIDRISLKRRVQADIARAAPSRLNDPLALLLGLLLYGLTIWRLHALLIGRALLPQLVMH